MVGYSCFCGFSDLCALQGWQVAVGDGDDRLLDHPAAMVAQQGLQPRSDPATLHVSQHWIRDGADEDGGTDPGQ